MQSLDKSVDECLCTPLGYRRLLFSKVVFLNDLRAARKLSFGDNRASHSSPAQALRASLDYTLNKRKSTMSLETTTREEKSYGCLVLLRPDGSQRSKFPLLKQKITFGRATFADVRIYDLSVSKLHAELNINSNHYLPARLIAHSPNGVLLSEDRQRISKGEGCNLVHGAVFQIAGRPFRYERAQSAEELVIVEVSLARDIL